MCPPESLVELEMHGESPASPGACRQEPPRQVQRYAVDVGAAELAESMVPQGHQGQRGQEMLAELPVAGPRHTLAIRLERERVDEDRPAPVELHVVGAAILQDH